MPHIPLGDVPHRRSHYFRDALNYNSTIVRLERSAPAAGTSQYRRLVAARKAFETSVRKCARATGCDPHTISSDARRRYGIMQGKGRYSRATGTPRPRGGRGFKRVLRKRGGREMLSRQFWNAHPQAAKPWWATENPRLMAMDEIATVHQHNPASAVAALERLASTEVSRGQVRPLEGGEVSDATRRRLMNDPNFASL